MKRKSWRLQILIYRTIRTFQPTKQFEYFRAIFDQPVIVPDITFLEQVRVNRITHTPTVSAANKKLTFLKLQMGVNSLLCFVLISIGFC